MGGCECFLAGEWVGGNIFHEADVNSSGSLSFFKNIMLCVVLCILDASCNLCLQIWPKHSESSLYLTSCHSLQC